jgi:hypothetical protein
MGRGCEVEKNSPQCVSTPKFKVQQWLEKMAHENRVPL